MRIIIKFQKHSEAIITKAKTETIIWMKLEIIQMTLEKHGR